jgi:hypothetical protein
MGKLFKILFFFVGMKYEEDAIAEIGDGLAMKNIWAYKKNQKKVEGWGDSVVYSKYQTPFLDRWRFFKLVVRWKDKPIDSLHRYMKTKNLK